MERILYVKSYKHGDDDNSVVTTFYRYQDCVKKMKKEDNLFVPLYVNPQGFLYIARLYRLHVSTYCSIYYFE